MIALIVAISRGCVIGDAQGMPWHLPADLKRFRQLTLGKPIIMGRTTFSHIGRPLEQRTNIVLTRQPAFTAPGAVVVHSFADALAVAGDVPEVMVVGGGEVYRAAIDAAERLYLTIVAGDFAGTAYFPDEWSVPAGYRWVVQQRADFPADAKNPHAHQFMVLERIAAPDQPAHTIALRDIIALNPQIPTTSSDVRDR